MKFQKIKKTFIKLIIQIKRIQYESDYFDNYRDLLGFKIGWMKKDNIDIFLESNLDFSFDECEIVIIHNFSQGDCHLHEIGESNFLVLGQLNGFKDFDGGIYVSDYTPGKTEYNLKERILKEGYYLSIPAKQIHAFFVRKGVMTVLGIVYPKIRKGQDEFDVVDFDYINEEKNQVVISGK
ncbi:MAG: hypothetical protein R3B55_01225 [Candidatus Paceibacterota bacterium]